MDMNYPAAQPRDAAHTSTSMTRQHEYSASSDPATLAEFLTALSSEPEREAVVTEIGVLQSIYGDDAITVWTSNENTVPHPDHQLVQGEKLIRYEIHVSLASPHDDLDTKIRVLVSLPRSYPEESPPQLQLLSRYIGAFSVDSALFGAILRTFMSKDGAEWTPFAVCVFDGLENVRERCARWYSERLSEAKTGELLRGDERERREATVTTQDRHDERASIPSRPAEVPAAMPQGVVLFESDPILDRKSIFIGRVCRITSPSQVPAVLAYLLSDRRIARAAHPIINAWRCRYENVLHQDNDDDGETAAGGRLAHLLQILDVENVLVVVTRYFGGIHLGPDRFKHINQVARNALERGGLLDTPNDTKGSGKSKARP